MGYRRPYSLGHGAYRIPPLCYWSEEKVNTDLASCARCGRRAQPRIYGAMTLYLCYFRKLGVTSKNGMILAAVKWACLWLAGHAQYGA